MTAFAGPVDLMVRDLAIDLHGVAVHLPVGVDAHPVLLRSWSTAGCGFEVSGPEQARSCLRAGAQAHQLLWTGRCSPLDDLAYAARLGVRRFLVGSPAQVIRLAAVAPGVEVVTEPDHALEVLGIASQLGLRGGGICVPALPGQLGIRRAVHLAIEAFNLMWGEGLHPWLLGLDLGPAPHGGSDVVRLSEQAGQFSSTVRRVWGPDVPELLLTAGGSTQEAP